MALNRPWKEQRVYRKGESNKKAKQPLIQPQLAMCVRKLEFFTSLCISANNMENIIIWELQVNSANRQICKHGACMLCHVQLFVTPMDYTPPGSSVHEIFQARTLEWVTIPFSKGSSAPKDWTPVSTLADGLYRRQHLGCVLCMYSAAVVLSESLRPHGL